jgi:hypothetical protein
VTQFTDSVAFSIGLGRKRGVSANGIPRHVEKDKRDIHLDLIGPLHRLGQIGIPRDKA